MSDEEQIREGILKLLQKAGQRPPTKSEIARALEVDPKRRKTLRKVLTQLESAGKVRLAGGGRYVIESAVRKGELQGVIRFDRKGFATVEVRNGKDAFEVHVPASRTATALDRDLVAVKLMKAPDAKFLRHIRNPRARARAQERLEDRKEGKVLRVVERRCTEIVGTFKEVKGKFLYVRPDNPIFPRTIEVNPRIDPLPEPPPRHEDKVIVEVTKWDGKYATPNGRVVEVLGHSGAPGVDIVSIIAKHRLPRNFPPLVIEEAKAFPEQVNEADIAGRDDWRDKPVFTIDPADARDFDDAILVTEREEGGFELAVHIADVSHYVKPGTTLDEEAIKRGNSTYLADRVLPMLPEELSNGLCSLNPHVDRLTRCVVLEFDKDGRPGAVRFAAAVIRSARRFTYEEAFALMSGDGEPPEEEDREWKARLRVAWKLASRLRKRRLEAGSLDMEFPEVRAVVDRETGRAVGLVRSEYDESHQLIEEFMLAANEAVAREIKNAMKPCIYRVHEDPDAGKLFEFREFVLGFGLQIGDPSERREVQALLKKIKGTREEHSIKIALLKSLKRADYRATPDGHYGLAKVNYTHFTSPIRRYADLVVHRVLDVVTRQSKTDTPTLGKLAEIAEHISKTERTSADAENESQRLKQLEYLASLSNAKGQAETFDAVVFDVRRIGVFVELVEYQIKGLVREEDLPATRHGYRYNGARREFVDSRGREGIAIADELRVKVKRVDLVKMRVDFVAEAFSHRS
ncbi:MAG: ribonuclease R [Verrucomicrobiota bacterium]